MSIQNQGAAAARNHALQLSQGDYIQWLDADDLLAPDKIERQLAALGEVDDTRVLLSSPWAPFYYRTRRARFVHTSLCQDLSPVEWLLRKMGENLHMQTATWLTSRELAEVAGPWDTRLLSDDDGEYFCRVLLASKGTRFVSETGCSIELRHPSPKLHRQLGQEKRCDAHSMKLHIQYLRSLEESERVRKACLTYIQTWYDNFYPERPDLVAELQALADGTSGSSGCAAPALEIRVDETGIWMESCKMGSVALPQLKASYFRHCDKAIYRLEASRAAATVRVGVSMSQRSGSAERHRDKR